MHSLMDHLGSSNNELTKRHRMTVVLMVKSIIAELMSYENVNFQLMRPLV